MTTVPTAVEALEVRVRRLELRDSHHEAVSKADVARLEKEISSLAADMAKQHQQQVEAVNRVTIILEKAFPEHAAAADTNGAAKPSRRRHR